MKEKSVIVISCVISALFILLTGWLSFYHTGSNLSEFLFVFHVIPYGLAYAGDASIFILLYYIFFFIGFAIFLSPFVLIYAKSKKKKRFFILMLSSIVLLTLFISYF